MLDDSDPLLIAKTRFPAERALGVVLLAILLVTVLLHGGR